MTVAPLSSPSSNPHTHPSLCRTLVVSQQSLAPSTLLHPCTLVGFGTSIGEEKRKRKTLEEKPFANSAIEASEKITMVLKLHQGRREQLHLERLYIGIVIILVKLFWKKPEQCYKYTRCQLVQLVIFRGMLIGNLCSWSSCPLSLKSKGIRFPGRDNESLAPIFTPPRSVSEAELDLPHQTQHDDIPVQSFTPEQTKEAFDVARNSVELFSTVLSSYTQQDVLQIMNEHKNPKVLSDGHLWIVSVDDFGVSHIKLKELIDFPKETGLQSSAAVTRNASIKLLGVLHRFIGPDIKGSLLMLSLHCSVLLIPSMRRIHEVYCSWWSICSSQEISLDWKVHLESVEAVNKILEEATYKAALTLLMVFGVGPTVFGNVSNVYKLVREKKWKCVTCLHCLGYGSSSSKSKGL
ncbi:hypothetical protein HN51_056430 [Arachis hypogaea]